MCLGQARGKSGEAVVKCGIRTRAAAPAPAPPPQQSPCQSSASVPVRVAVPVSLDVDPVVALKSFPRRAVSSSPLLPPRLARPSPAAPALPSPSRAIHSTLSPTLQAVPAPCTTKVSPPPPCLRAPQAPSSLDAWLLRIPWAGCRIQFRVRWILAYYPVERVHLGAQRCVHELGKCC